MSRETVDADRLCGNGTRSVDSPSGDRQQPSASQIVEHRLNDTLVLRYDIASSEAAASVATSKFKNVAGDADKIRTPILLQDHNTVWFRNLKIRELPQH